jgi:hypothetical protein
MFKTFLIGLLAALSVTTSAQALDSDFERGQQFYQARRYGESIAAFTRLTARQPSSDVAHYYLGMAYMANGSENQAILEYKKALALSQSPQMAAYSRAMLKRCGITPPPLPSAGAFGMGSRQDVRGGLAPAESQSLSQFVQMATAAHDSRGSKYDSSPEGVEVYKNSQDKDPQLDAGWRRWNEDFRMFFAAQFLQRLRSVGVNSLFGQTRILFSCDKNHKLRGKILDTSLPDQFLPLLLDAVRNMDGKTNLAFPSGSQIDGYNFTVGWSFANPPPEVQEKVAIAMRSSNTHIQLIGSREDQARAARMKNIPVETQRIGNGAIPIGSNPINTAVGVANQSVNGALRPVDEANAKAGLLSNGKDTAAGLVPGFDAQVSGHIVPKPTVEELKAKAKPLK